MSPHQLAVEAENAYDMRDRDKLRLALLQLVVLAESQRKCWAAVIAGLPQEQRPLDESE